MEQWTGKKYNNGGGGGGRGGYDDNPTGSRTRPQRTHETTRQARRQPRQHKATTTIRTTPTPTTSGRRQRKRTKNTDATTTARASVRGRHTHAPPPQITIAPRDAGPQAAQHGSAYRGTVDLPQAWASPSRTGHEGRQTVTALLLPRASRKGAGNYGGSKNTKVPSINPSKRFPF